MSMLRAEKIIDYLSDPLERCLRDNNPYVRKTAAVCVAKLYDINPELAIEGGFVDQLRELVGDSNPMVRHQLLDQSFFAKSVSRPPPSDHFHLHRLSPTQLLL